MMRCLKSRFAGLAILGACLTHLNPVAAQSAPGFSMTMKTTFETDTGGVKQMEMKTEATKGHLRLTMSGSLVAAAADTYIIYDLTGSTMSMVMPSLSMATLMDTAAIHGAASQAMKTETKGVPKLEVEDKGAGEPILGLQTHRYHVKSETTIIYSTASGSCEKTRAEDVELWNTTTFELPAVYIDALRTVAGTAGSADSKLEKMIRATTVGFTVKSISTIATHAGAGPVSLLKSSEEMTAFVKGNIDDSRFAVPDGYRTMDSRQLMANMDPEKRAEVMAAGVERQLEMMCGAVAKKS
jgi:hypothetical protein